MNSNLLSLPADYRPIGTASTLTTPGPSSGSVEGSASVTHVLSGYVASGVDAGSCTAPSAHASLKGCVDDMPCGARSHSEYSEQRTVSLVVVDMLPMHAAPSVAQVTPGDAHTMQQRWVLCGRVGRSTVRGTCMSGSTSAYCLGGSCTAEANQNWLREAGLDSDRLQGIVHRVPSDHSSSSTLAACTALAA